MPKITWNGDKTWGCLVPYGIHIYCLTDYFSYQYCSQPPLRCLCTFLQEFVDILKEECHSKNLDSIVSYCWFQYWCVWALKNYSLLTMQHIPGFVLSTCIRSPSKVEAVLEDLNSSHSSNTCIICLPLFTVVTMQCKQRKRNLCCLSKKWMTWKNVIIYLSERTSSRVNPGVYYGLCVVMMFQCKFIHCNKWTTVVKVVHSSGSCEVGGRRDVGTILCTF